MADFIVKGAREMAKRLEEIAKSVPQIGAKALRMEAEEIMTTAKRDYVPVDLGTLRSSGRVLEPRVQARSVSVPMRFGGAAAAYALAVHEHLSEHSPPSWQGKAITEILSVRDRKAWSLTGRGPKYLERAMSEALPGMDDRVAKAIAAEMK